MSQHICGFHKNFCRETKKRIERTVKQNIRWDEVSITGSYLNDLLDKFGAERVQIYMFTQRQESVNGADWLYAIRNNSQWTLFLIQAKRMSKKRVFEYLWHSEDQVDNLISAASQIGAWPIYVFYGSSLGVIRTPRCPNITKDFDLSGATVLPAEYVKNRWFRSRYKPHINTIIGNAASLSWLFCSDSSGNNQSDPLIRNQIEKVFEDLEESIDSSFSRSKDNFDLPLPLRQIRDLVSKTDRNYREQAELEALRESLPNVSGVAFFDAVGL